MKMIIPWFVEDCRRFFFFSVNAVNDLPEDLMFLLDVMNLNPAYGCSKKDTLWLCQQLAIENGP